MIRRLFILVAAAAYLTVLACSVRPGGGGSDGDAGHARHSLFNTGDAPAPGGEGGPPFRHASLASLPYRSVGMQLQRVDWMDKYKQSMDEIVEVGADTVLLVVDMRQENGSSSQIYLDMRLTPTGPQLEDLIRYAKGKKLRVILMPIVLLDHPKGGEWRGTLHPDSPSDWWDSYRSGMTHYATVAAESDVDLLVVGSELVSMEPKLHEWTMTINMVRGIYKGQLTYSSNWDHYTPIQFWDQLDLVGMNSYWKMGDDSKVSVDQIIEHWREIQKNLLPFLRKVNKPLLFTEIGWFSQSNTAAEPWDYTKEGEPVDMDLQKRLYEGFFRAWYGNPQLGGFSVWEWPPGDGGKGYKPEYRGSVPIDTPEDTARNWRGYTPENKPAEKVLREWLAKPKWKVE